MGRWSEARKGVCCDERSFVEGGECFEMTGVEVGVEEVIDEIEFFEALTFYQTHVLYSVQKC